MTMLFRFVFIISLWNDYNDFLFKLCLLEIITSIYRKLRGYKNKLRFEVVINIWYIILCCTSVLALELGIESIGSWKIMTRIVTSVYTLNDCTECCVPLLSIIKSMNLNIIPAWQIQSINGLFVFHKRKQLLERVTKYKLKYQVHYRKLRVL